MFGGLHVRPFAAIAAASGLVLAAACSRPPAPTPASASTPADAAAATSFDGVWVMSLGSRPFIVLTVAAPGGTTSHPSSFGLSEGGRFSKIVMPVVSQPVSQFVVSGSRATFVIVDPKDPSEPDRYEFELVDPTHATLTWKDVPIETKWPFVRQASSTPPVVPTDWDVDKIYTTQADVTTDNAEMAKIFDEDQKPRQEALAAKAAPDWARIEKDDAARRQQTKALLDAGALHTGHDYQRAAFIFQHGDGPNDYLLAHTLAAVATAKGNADAIWIGAATLDRYLQSIGRPQIYGTQTLTPDKKPPTQDPYDRRLISDALRQELGVPSMASQQRQLDEARAPSTGH